MCHGKLRIVYKDNYLPNEYMQQKQLYDVQTKDIYIRVEIVPEQFLILFRPGTTPLRSGLGTFYVPVPDQAKHFLLDVELIIIIN